MLITQSALLFQQMTKGIAPSIIQAAEAVRKAF